MIQNFTLSETNTHEAITQLNDLIEDPWTVLMVLGKTIQSKDALAICSQKINSGHPYYAGVRCVHAPNPDIVVSYLSNLKASKDIDVDWSQIHNYLILSISAIYNNIGWIYTLQNFPGSSEVKVNRLIVKAQATDLLL